MSTIDDAMFVRQLIRNDGCHEDDPQVLAIYRYRNPSVEKDLFMVGWMQIDVLNMIASPLVEDAVLLWDRSGATEAGLEFLR